MVREGKSIQYNTYNLLLKKLYLFNIVVVFIKAFQPRQILQIIDINILVKLCICWFYIIRLYKNTCLHFYPHLHYLAILKYWVLFFGNKTIFFFSQINWELLHLLEYIIADFNKKFLQALISVHSWSDSITVTSNIYLLFGFHSYMWHRLYLNKIKIIEIFGTYKKKSEINENQDSVLLPCAHCHLFN